VRKHDGRTARTLLFGSQAQEFSFHGVDLGNICCDVVIAATLPGHETKAAARECRRWTCAAQMDHSGQLLPLLTADADSDEVAR
jgi:hypothetical protein